MSNVEAVLTMKEDYSRLKQPIRAKLEVAIEKEINVQSYLDKILQALKSLETDVLKLDTDSRSRLCDMVTLRINRFLRTRSKEEENEAFLSDLFSLIGNSSQTQTFQEIETDLNSRDEVLELPNLVNSTQISVKLYSEESIPLQCPELLEKGFTTKWKELASSSNPLLLISHLILRAQKKYNLEEIPPTASASSVDLVHSETFPPTLTKISIER